VLTGRLKNPTESGDHQGVFALSSQAIVRGLELSFSGWLEVKISEVIRAFY
jgi:hypothetical protein